MKRLFSLFAALCLLAGCGQAAVSEAPSGAAPSASSAGAVLSPPEEDSPTPVSSVDALPLPAEDLPASPLEPDQGDALPQPPAVGALDETLDEYTAKVLSQQTLLSSAPAVQSWPAAYESFYSAYDRAEGLSFSETYQYLEIRDQFAFPLRFLDANVLLESWLLRSAPFTALAANDLIGEPNPDLVGLLLNRAETGDFYGEAVAEPCAEERVLEPRNVMQYAVGQYAGRQSMTMTAGLEAQLLALGFSPETTTACALDIRGYTHGVVFFDGNRVCFYNNEEYDGRENAPKTGVVYSFDQLAESLWKNRDGWAAELLTSAPRGTPYENPPTAKPVIYLYPTEQTDVTVTLGYPAEHLTYTYPAYDGGWRVTAHPDGTLLNQSDGTEHYYLFWEGNKKIDWDFSEGFVVRGEDAESFLREKLRFLGLTPREYNDFIVYWAPELSANAYNLITFTGEQYEALAPLEVSPKPDHILRVHMVYKAIDRPVDLPEQTLVPFQRSGFTVVEWGGTRA